MFTPGYDPLLGSNQNIETRMQELKALKDMIEQKEQSLGQIKAQMVQPQPSQPKAPIWDEIDSIIQGLSDEEYEFVTQNDEFVESSENIKAILNSAYMEMMRPIIENSEKGKEALDAHLTLVKRLKKAAHSEVTKQMADFKEYMEKYSNMTYADYQKMKREPKQNKK